MPNRRKILLVEDSPTQAARLRILLENDGLQVSHYQTAEAALEHIESDGPDVIVLDYHLPGMNGAQFCREIRLNVNTRAIPVLMLTVEMSGAAEAYGLESGADDYVSKSADPDILLMRIKALLRASKGTSAIVDVEKRFSKTRLLAVDDSPTYLRHIANELSEEHYSIETASNPLDALERVKTSAFDCVLVDFSMPKMTGADVCRKIRESRSDTEIVLVMLSSHEDKEHMTLAFEAGADDYIVKSADVSVAKARIRALLRRKYLVEENRRILEEIKEKELQTLRARAEREAAQIRAMMADQLESANRELALANQRLDRANHELEQFAYAAAHDLREPLRVVRIFSQLLEKQYSNQLDEKAHDYITRCVEGTRRMDRLIEDLLEYARAASVDEQCAAPADFNQIMERALANLQHAIDESGATIQAGPLPVLCVEEIRAQQLFQNLIGNAIKYRRSDVPLRVEVRAERRDDDWVFSVTDNGLGIDAENREKIFSLFKRVHLDRSGTGLGLNICQRVVERYGGRIWVESEPNQGSTFYFTLPAKLEQKSQVLSAST